MFPKYHGIDKRYFCTNVEKSQQLNIFLEKHSYAHQVLKSSQYQAVWMILKC